MKRAAAILALLIVLLLAAAIGVLYFQFPHANFDFLQTRADFEENLPPGRILSPEELRADAEFITAEIERAHPAFVRDPGIMKTWNEAKERYFKECEREMSVGDFEFATNRMLRSLNDGHTTVYLRLGDEILDLEWKLSDDRLFLNDETEIASVGGLPTEEYLAFLSDYFTEENESEARHRIEGRVGRSKTVLEKAGAEFSDTLDLLLREDGNERAVQASFRQAETSAASNGSDSNIRYQLIDDVFYMDYLACEWTEELEESAKALSKALDEGIRKVIIDVRANGGGNSLANRRLFQALKMVPPEDDVEIRLSPLSRSFAGTVGTEGYIVLEGNRKIRRNENIHLIVLTSSQTYSSAMMLALYVQDGQLGTVIGEVPGNNASSYGDRLTFQAPESRILLGVSYKYWQRPDAQKGLRLVPDIEVEAEGAFERALKYLKEQES